jgi:hypothetical protein
MGASRWDPAQLGPTDTSHVGSADAVPVDPANPSRELAQHLRFLLDREGLTPRQLASEADVPYSPAMLYRFFSGESLPPPQLIEVMARRCGGDFEGLQSAYDRARLAAVGAFATPGRQSPDDRSPDAGQGPRHRKPKQRRGRPKVAATVGFSALGVIVLTATAVGTLEQSAADTASDRQRQRPSAQRPAADAPPPVAPEPVLIPESSQRNSSAKRKPKASPSPTPRREEAQPAVPAPVAALLANGTFTGTVSPWVATPGLAVQPEDNQMRIGVPRQENDAANGGLVRSNTFPLQPGRTYQLRFDASANQPVSIAALVQTQGDSLQNVLVAAPQLSDALTTRTFSFQIEAGAAPAPGTVVFQLGSLEERYAVSIDNVSLTQTG